MRKIACILSVLLVLSGCGLGRRQEPAKKTLAAEGTENASAYAIRNAEGKPANPLMLYTEGGQGYGLYDVVAKHTVLYFYDPACACCGAATDALYDLFENSRDLDLNVYAVYTGRDRKSWIMWLAEGGYTDWINVWNASGDNRIYENYDLPELPVIYLLDKDKRIEVGNISFSALYYIVNQLMRD